MPLPHEFESGTIFGIYDGVVPVSRDDTSFAVMAWDVPYGRPFAGELYDLECELVSESDFRAFVRTVSIFRRCIARWTKALPLHMGRRAHTDLELQPAITAVNTHSPLGQPQ